MTLPQIVETLITASEEPLDSEGVAAAIRQSVALRAAELAEGETLPDHLTPYAETTAEEVDAAVGALNEAYIAHGHALAIAMRPRGWQLMTRPEFADYLVSLFPERRMQRLSGPALETLAIIAYRQPVTKAEIESVRGVSADGMLQKLLDLEFVKIGGRAEVPGRPLQYVTTEKFLEHFNLREVGELPNSQELRRVKLPTAEEVHGEAGAGSAEPEAGTGGAAPADEEESPGQTEIALGFDNSSPESGAEGIGASEGEEDMPAGDMVDDDGPAHGEMRER